MLVLAISAIACGGSDVTRARVERAVGTTFGNRYAAAVPGASARSAGAAATCDRGGPAVADEGAGDDWTCLLSWVDPAGQVQQAAYGLQVHPDGCFAADPDTPPAVVAPFEGCTGAG